jgi:hypothetical protein
MGVDLVYSGSNVTARASRCHSTTSVLEEIIPSPSVQPTGLLQDLAPIPPLRGPWESNKHVKRAFENYVARYIRQHYHSEQGNKKQVRFTCYHAHKTGSSCSFKLLAVPRRNPDRKILWHLTADSCVEHTCNYSDYVQRPKKKETFSRHKTLAELCTEAFLDFRVPATEEICQIVRNFEGSAISKPTARSIRTLARTMLFGTDSESFSYLETMFSDFLRHLEGNHSQFL